MRSLLLAPLLLCHFSFGVQVVVRKTLPVPPSEAKVAWLQYAWGQGGGLPLVASLTSEDGQERTLLPLFLRERLQHSGRSPPDDESDVVYKLTDAGALRLDVVAASHEGRVSFDEGNTSTTTDLTWTVAFDCTARDWLWEAVTRYTVETVLANCEAYCARPTTFTLIAKLPALPADCLAMWLELLESGDLGVPMPPPIVLDEGEGSTRVGYERLIFPPGLRERVLELESGEDQARAAYTVVNPSWLTCYVS